MSSQTAPSRPILKHRAITWFSNQPTLGQGSPLIIPAKYKPWARLLWIIGILTLAVLHAIHLRADFPNFSPWMDYAKYTDEGWYGDAAIRHYLSGSWYRPGDFNPAAALPVWPFLEFIVFRFTGVSIQAARGLVIFIFFCNLLLTYRVMRTQQPRPEGERWVALLAITLVAASSFLYCFSRLAILEPLLVCLTLTSLLIALRLPRIQSANRRSALGALLGLLFCAMVLTKTTGIFLLPAILYSLWYPQRRMPRQFLRSIVIMAVTAGTLFAAYFFLLIRPRYLVDYRYLFSANVNKLPDTLFRWIAAFYYAFHGMLWIDPTIPLLALALIGASVFVARDLWRNPLFVSSLLAIGGIVFFIGFHNFMQPRYYAVIAFFLFIVVTQASAAFHHRHRVLGAVALLIVTVSVTYNLRRTINFVRHPEYTWVTAAARLTRYIDEHPNGNRLLLSISGSDITLITHMPSICDDFGTLDLPSRILKYQPGWYASWDSIDAGSLEDIHSHDWLEQVATFDAFDDEDRDQLVLFKMHPLAPGEEPHDIISVPVE